MSHAGGYFFRSSNPDMDPHPPLNGAIHVMSNIMRNVMASASKAKVGALFHNGQKACPLQNTLQEMGWPGQPPPYKLTTPSPMALPTIPSNSDAPALSICDSTGYGIVSDRANS